MGFEVKRIHKGPTDRTYEKIYPIATYSPWNADLEFDKLYASIKEFTLVDKYRCYELWNLVCQSAKLPTGALIEVGVWRGGTGAVIAEQARRCDIREPVYLCDTFAGVVKAGHNDSDYKGGEHADADATTVQRLLDMHVLPNARILKGVFPDETGYMVSEQTFRFCHIDVDVYRSAADITAWIWPMLVSGGIIVYDDYGFENCQGITKHVNEQIGSRDRFVLHNLNGHAVVIKR
jgi:O-methyltransferase